MMKYLVLGGNGFIGKYIVDRISEFGDVVVADYNIEHAEDSKPNVEYKKIDFCSCEDFSSYLEDIDVVVHLISTIGPSDKTENINKEISDNVFPTIRLLDSMNKCGTKKIIFVSSGGTVYGEHELSPIKEEEAKNPICNYGIIKELIEKYLNLYNLYYGIEYRVARLGNPYSEVVKQGRKQGIIPIFIDQMLNNETLKVWGDGNDVRDYIYMDDAIDAIIKIINYNGQEKVFNVGTGVGFSINDLIRIINDKLNIENLQVSYLASRKCDVKYNVLDIQKTMREINWEPKISLDEGIQKVIDIKKGYLR